MDKRAGKFVWFQLTTTDIAAAISFYHKTLGLTSEAMDIGGVPYTLLSAGTTAIAGVVDTTDPDAEAMAPLPSWVGFVSVDDVDRKAEEVILAGGTISVMPSDIPGVGRYAVAADTDNVPFVLYQSADPESIPDVNPGTHGLVGWSELQTTDTKTAMAFYGGLFGWQEVAAHDMGPMGIYHIFGLGDMATGGVFAKHADSAAGWLYYFIVDTAGAAAMRVEEAGGKIIIPPREVPGGGWIVRCQDPQGAQFAMMASLR